MGTLMLIRPTGGSISSVFNEDRKKKDKVTNKIIKYKHKGIDYAAAKGTPVAASEGGTVMAAYTNIPGYGNLILIDHTPDAEDNKRNIYTLYAHLDKMYVQDGDYVEKYETIGAVGHTGYAYSKTGKDPSHLHFEVIDCLWKASNTDILNKKGRAREYRKNPADYFGIPKKVEGALTDIVDRNIMDRIEWVPDIDFMRADSFRLQAWLDGKNIGYVNKYHDRLEADIEYDLKEELDKIGRGPLRKPQDETIRLEYTISLQ